MAFEDQRHFVMLLCLKGNGVLDSECPNDPYRERLIAKALGLDPISATEAKRRLMEGGLIGDDWQPAAWDKRQFESDSSAKRVRRFREKQKGNVTETLQERPCNAIDKIRRDKTREDKNKTAQAPVPGLDEKSWEQWQAYRKLKPASIEAARRKLARLGSLQAIAVEHSIANGYTGFYAPKNSPPQVDTTVRNERIAQLEQQGAPLGLVRDASESPAVFETRIKQARLNPVAVPPPAEIAERMKQLSRKFTSQ